MTAPTREARDPLRRTGRLVVISTIARANVTRLTRDRLGLFFIFVLPFLIILIFGVAAGGGALTPGVGLVADDDGPLAAALVDRLDASEAVAITRYEDRAALERGLRRQAEQAGVVIAAGFDAALRAGRDVDVALLTDPTGGLPEVARSVVAAAVAETSAVVEAGRLVAGTTGVDVVEAFTLAAAVDEEPRAGVAVETVVTDEAVAGYDPLRQAASGQLVLFVFITSLVGSSALVETRRLGMSRRMLSTPTTAGVLLLGEAGARFAIACFQAVIVVAGSALLFGMAWGDPLVVTAVIVLFSLAGTGASMLMGARFDNAEQASNVAVPLGIGLGMLGGCMWPLEITPAAVQAVGRLTPHAWAMDALGDVTMRGAGLADVSGALAVLATYAAVLLTFASWQLRRSLTA